MGARQITGTEKYFWWLNGRVSKEFVSLGLSKKEKMGCVVVFHNGSTIIYSTTNCDDDLFYLCSARALGKLINNFL